MRFGLPPRSLEKPEAKKWGGPGTSARKLVFGDVKGILFGNYLQTHKTITSKV